jgi:hypothetical protein
MRAFGKAFAKAVANLFIFALQMANKHLALLVSFSVENGFNAALLVAAKRYSQVVDENRITAFRQRQMTKPGKILLYFISSLPLLWTISILICAFFYIRHPDMVMYFIYTCIFYLKYGGLIAWTITLIILRLLKRISSKTIILNFILIACGLLAAYLSLAFDLFGVSGTYLD